MLLFGDYIILLVSVLFGIIGIGVGTNTVYKIYFGMIFGFLLFLVFNLQIKLLDITRPGDFNVLESFLMKNKSFCLGMSSISVLLIGLSLSMGGKKGENNNIFSSFILGFFLFIFYIGVNSYILNNSVIKLTFLNDIFSSLKLSSIYTFFLGNPHYIFILIIFVLCGKIINLLLLGFGTYLIEVIKSLFGNIRERQNEINEMQEELNTENRKKRLMW